MRIALEARALTQPASGSATYARHLVAALRRVAPESDVRLLQKGPGSDVSLPIWINTVVPHWLHAQRPDVVHFTKAALPFVQHYPTVVTIYDVIPILFPQSQTAFARLVWPGTLRHAAQQADHIITISEASKKDIVKHLSVMGEKVTVTPLAVNSEFEIKNIRLTGPTSKTYILFLGTIEPRKNVPALVRAFARIASDIPHTLVIAGRQYKGIEDVRTAIRTTGLIDRVTVRDTVPARELPALYANADLFVWPSIYEGWGFPPQEAMAAGTPVIVSDGGSLPEVVGDAGEVVPFTVNSISARPHDTAFEAALAERIRSVLVNPAKQTAMRTAGLMHVQKHSWDEVARTTLDVYRRVI